MSWLELHDAEHPDQMVALPASKILAIEVWMGHTIVRTPWALIVVSESPSEVLEQLRESEAFYDPRARVARALDALDALRSGGGKVEP